MRELNIPFREVLVPFGGAQNPDAFRAFSPTGKVPCLVDGTTTVWDSLAITEYLAERHAGVWPADPVARAWARSAAAEMHSGFQALRNTCGMNCGLQGPTAFDRRGADSVICDRIEQLWADGLARFGGPFLTGATLLRRRCVLCAGGIPHPDLRPAADRRRRSATPRSCSRCQPCSSGTPRR